MKQFSQVLCEHASAPVQISISPLRRPLFHAHREGGRARTLTSGPVRVVSGRSSREIRHAAIIGALARAASSAGAGAVQWPLKIIRRLSPDDVVTVEHFSRQPLLVISPPLRVARWLCAGLWRHPLPSISVLSSHDFSSSPSPLRWLGDACLPAGPPPS